ncbi:ExeA family protein [Maridesulfovibrio bastinii]|uniref:ExeA family protein n=1 Tax=Maridesulfovibrio bastinii TaxID=47157 RepID=UPI000406A8EC|nr:AAA family ATPase [Maridesulfovibrio bastinii]
MRKLSELFNSFGDSSTVFSFFPSESHKKAVHRIVVGLDSMCGLVMLTGEIGTGKTTLFRFIQRQKTDKFIYAEIGNPFLSPVEQVSHFCKSFGLESPKSHRHGLALLTDFFEKMHKEGKRVVLIFDESHLLTKTHWGQILVFSNLRENDKPLVQILLVGQTELVERLREPGLEALNQRIGIRCRLLPLSLEDTSNYVRFKLEKSQEHEIEFTSRALTEVWKLSGGVPRLINHACSHLLDQIVFSGDTRITPDMVQQLASDGMYSNLFNSKPKNEEEKKVSLLPWILAAFLAACALFVFVDHRTIEKALDFSGVREKVASNEIRGSVVNSSQAVSSAGSANGSQKENRAFEAQQSLNKNVSATADEASGETGSLKSRSTGNNQKTGNASTVEKKGTASSSERTDRKSEGNDSGVKAEDGLSVKNIDTNINDQHLKNNNTDDMQKSVAGKLKKSNKESVDAVEKNNFDGRDISSDKNLTNLDSEDGYTDSKGEILDGESVPAIASIAIGAVAFSDNPGSRIAVLNDSVMHEGSSIGNIRLDHIGKDELIFSLGNNKYRRVFGGQADDE